MSSRVSLFCIDQSQSPCPTVLYHPLGLPTVGEPLVTGWRLSRFYCSHPHSPGLLCDCLLRCLGLSHSLHRLVAIVSLISAFSFLSVVSCCRLALPSRSLPPDLHRPQGPRHHRFLLMPPQLARSSGRHRCATFLRQRCYRTRNALLPYRVLRSFCGTPGGEGGLFCKVTKLGFDR